MSSTNDESLLHEAAKSRQVPKIRKLLYDIKCDPNTLNTYGRTPAFMYFINLLTKAETSGSDDCLSPDEIGCFVELLWYTYDTRISRANERCEIFDMIDYCFQFSDAPIRKLYMEIVNVFITPSHHRRYFVDKILEANLPSDYCLIASMFDMNELLKTSKFVNLRSYFICELFALFMADKSFFEEYISEVMSTGWTLNIQDQFGAFLKQLEKRSSVVTLFNFMEYLIVYEIDFGKFVKFCILHLSADARKDIVNNVFVPLSNFINAPIDLARMLRQVKAKKLTYYNFNETENVFDDFKTFAECKCKFTQVVSLKNLSRMSVRKFFFQNHTHFKALSLLYSLEIPIKLRNFLCYNYSNLKFETFGK